MNANGQPSDDARRAFMNTCAFCNTPLAGEIGAMITIKDVNGRPGVAVAHSECVLSRLHPAMKAKLEQLAV